MAEEFSERVEVTVSDDDRRVTVRLSGRTGQISAGGNGLDGYLFLRSDDGEERVRLDGRAGSLYAGGNGASGRAFISKTVTSGSHSADHVSISLDGQNGNLRAGANGADGDLLLFPGRADDIREDRAATIWLDSGNGNIRAGGHSTDGDVLLFPPNADDIRQDSQASIWLDAGRGNIAVGGNGRDGDLLLFPRTATIATDETAQSTVWIDGDSGNIRLQGGLIPKFGPANDTRTGGYSTDEGYVAAFEGRLRHGKVDFTYENDEGSGDRRKLRNIHIYHPLLHENSIVYATSHAGEPCVATVSYLPRADVTGHSGYFIDLHPLSKMSPGRNVKVVYWIMN
ncbi:hypothetical protein [Roseibium sp. Sym1]|uniref:hypothetical protein n=1 Tax=Roseibium sp. Sym1 TaxID=3016006 RepID=UPI0022B41196|nr:hypothetical protein [Roseibium sp. Sym1]